MSELGLRHLLNVFEDYDIHFQIQMSVCGFRTASTLPNANRGGKRAVINEPYLGLSSTTTTSLPHHHERCSS